MLVTPETNRKNRTLALVLAIATVGVFAALAIWDLRWMLGVALGPVVYWWVRRECLRRRRVMAQPFPPAWEAILHSKVAYFNALDDLQRERFRQLVKIFLDETRLTGIRTDVDETTRVLVGASAVIPVFNFDGWEYSRLGEVLIYPGNFDDDYRSDGDGPRHTLGMVGAGHLRGVMILSKPALLSGFDISGDKDNVGIHEFAHLVDAADGSFDGIPPGVPADVTRAWIEWVGQELADPAKNGSHIKEYAYTNEAEYFASLVEYFFEAPAVLKRKNPELYQVLTKMFQQDTATMLPGVTMKRARRIGRNSPCPCGCGQKYKKCCLRAATQGVPVVV